MCGAILFSAQCGSLDKKNLGLDELCFVDDDIEPAESEKWLCSIDRGRLTRIMDDAYLKLHTPFPHWHRRSNFTVFQVHIA